MFGVAFDWRKLEAICRDQARQSGVPASAVDDAFQATALALLEAGSEVTERQARDAFMREHQRVDAASRRRFKLERRHANALETRTAGTVIPPDREARLAREVRAQREPEPIVPGKTHGRRTKNLAELARLAKRVAADEVMNEPPPIMTNREVQERWTADALLRGAADGPVDERTLSMEAEIAALPREPMRMGVSSKVKAAHLNRVTKQLRQHVGQRDPLRALMMPHTEYDFLEPIALAARLVLAGADFTTSWGAAVAKTPHGITGAEAIALVADMIRGRRKRRGWSHKPRNRTPDL